MENIVFMYRFNKPGDEEFFDSLTKEQDELLMETAAQDLWRPGNPVAEIRFLVNDNRIECSSYNHEDELLDVTEIYFEDLGVEERA